ncbi:unnamed protein product [Heterobilharzia americana]|nr:unnamed protein product [Heterobilharzia americana]
MPGGMGGSKAMAESTLVGKILKEHEKNNKYIAAICAAPIALESHGILKGKKLTSYPGFKEKLPSYTYCEDNVVVDDKLVTSRGPGTAFAFAMKLVELLCGDSKAQNLKKDLSSIFRALSSCLMSLNQSHSSTIYGTQNERILRLQISRVWIK